MYEILKPFSKARKQSDAFKKTVSTSVVRLGQSQEKRFLSLRFVVGRVKKAS